MRAKMLRSAEAAGIAVAEERYGRGRGEGLSPRGYHNAPHAELVVRSVRLLLGTSAGSGLSDTDRELLPVAAAWHDAVYEPGRDDNEARSAEELSAWMLQEGFGEQEAQRASELVMATAARIGDAVHGYSLCQSATDPAGALLCDADVSSWGLPWPEFIPWWHGLACEIAGRADFVEDFGALPVDLVRGFLAGQADLLAGHHYLTPAAETLWGAQRNRNALLTRELLEGLESTVPPPGIPS